MPLKTGGCISLKVTMTASQGVFSRFCVLLPFQFLLEYFFIPIEVFYQQATIPTARFFIFSNDYDTRKMLKTFITVMNDNRPCFNNLLKIRISSNIYIDEKTWQNQQDMKSTLNMQL